MNESSMPTESEMEAFERGQQAYLRGAELADNPYPEDSDLHLHWMFGWEHEKHH